MARSPRIGPINVCRRVHGENARNRLALWVIRLAKIRRGARYYADCDPLDHQLLSPATGPTVLPKITVTTSIDDLHNPTRSAPAMCISRGPPNHRDLNGDIGSDPADRASAAEFHGTIGEKVVINPALAISGIEPTNQCYYNPAYYLIVSDCANTNIGVVGEQPRPHRRGSPCGGSQTASTTPRNPRSAVVYRHHTGMTLADAVELGVGLSLVFHPLLIIRV
jgi:hypothetical protein